MSPTFIEPPNDVDVPLIVIALLANAEFGIALNLALGTVPEDKLDAFKEDPSMNPLSLLKPEILILPLVNFFCALAASTTAKKSPSASF
jgi:hypothetical protein